MNAPARKRTARQGLDPLPEPEELVRWVEGVFDELQRQEGVEAAEQSTPDQPHPPQPGPQSPLPVPPPPPPSAPLELPLVLPVQLPLL